MRAFHYILLPSLCAGAIYVSRLASGRTATPVEKQTTISRDSIPDTGQRANIPPPEKVMTWEEISRLSPTLENRWQALDFFKQQAQSDPLSFATILLSLQVDQCSLWPGREPIRHFFLTWAAIDSDKAWAFARESKDAEAINAVAGVLATTNPREVLADEFASADVRLLAQTSLPISELQSVSDPKTRLQLLAHALLSGPLNEETMAAAERVADPESSYEAGRWRKQIAQRLVEGSRGQARALLESESAIKTLTDPFESPAANSSLLNSIRDAYVNSIPPGAIDEALSLPESMRKPVVDPFSSELAHDFTGLARAWDDASLAKATDELSSGLRASKVTTSLWNACFNELLQRNPAALLPMINQLPPDFRVSSGAQFSGADMPLNKETAASARTLIENAPVGLKNQLLQAMLPVLTEFEFAFTAQQLAAGNSFKPSATAAVSSGKDVPLPKVDTSAFMLRWLENDATAATSYLQKNPEIVTSQEIQSTAKNWVKSDPESASQWLTTLPAGERKDAAINGMLDVLKWHDPASSLAWAGQISQPEARHAAQASILRTWGQWAPTAAAQAAAALHP